MKTLAGVAHGLSRNLIERAADVMLKERRPLVIVPRETPMSLPQLKNMVLCAEAGAMILPAMPAFYQLPKTLDDLADFMAGKILRRSASSTSSIRHGPVTLVQSARDLSARRARVCCSQRRPDVRSRDRSLEVARPHRRHVRCDRRRGTISSIICSAPASIAGGGERAIRSLALTGRERVLDLCTGTADLAIAAIDARPPAPRASSASTSPPRCCGVGRDKLRERRLDRAVTLVRGDATRDSGRDRLRRCGDRRLWHSQCRGHRRWRATRFVACSRQAAVLPFSNSRCRRRRGVAARILVLQITSCRAIGRVVSRHDAAYGYLPGVGRRVRVARRVRENSATERICDVSLPAR